MLKDIALLERVQRWATKHILEFPLTINLGSLSILDHISFVSSTTRASSYAKISLKKAHLNVSSHSFFFRIVLLACGAVFHTCMLT